MANQEQVTILKQGAEVWNSWRKKNPQAIINFSYADLCEAKLSEIDLSETNLSRAYLSETNLSRACLRKARHIGVDLREADLREADLREADLKEANLSYADLSGANLSGANLREANLNYAKLRETNLREANLSYADLGGAYLSEVNLIGANCDKAIFGNTILTKTYLSQTFGLESIQHIPSSSIGIDTIQISKGEIPDVFLRGCGLSDWEIESAKLYKPDLINKEIDEILCKIQDLRANQAIQISPLFISYSHADTPFVEKLEPHLTDKGIRFWRDSHDMRSGRMEKQVDHAMRQNPTVILILSENSLRSDWVEHEARLARELEKEFGRDVLCPIALDGSWKSAKWPARLMEQIKEYNILDYSNWNNDKAFTQVFNKMISGLDMFYKPNKESSK